MRAKRTREEVQASYEKKLKDQAQRMRDKRAEPGYQRVLTEEERIKKNERKKARRHGVYARDNGLSVEERAELYRQRYLDKRFRNREERKAPTSWTKIGATWDDWDDLWQKQEGLCNICSTPLVNPTRKERGETGKNRSPLDHCHKTLRLRGILCHSCNIHLGWLENRWSDIMAHIGA